MRRSLRKRLPTAHEMVYEYRDLLRHQLFTERARVRGRSCNPRSADGVRLYFNRGKGLPDPEKLLQGSGSQVRWIPVEGASTLARPAVARLIDERHRSQSRAVRRRRSRVGGHSFDIGQEAWAEARVGPTEPIGRPSV